PLVSNSPLSATLPPFRIMAAARRNNAASDSIKQSTLNHQFSKWADTPDQKPKLAAVTAFRFSDHPNRSSEKTIPLGCMDRKVRDGSNPITQSRSVKSKSYVTNTGSWSASFAGFSK